MAEFQLVVFKLNDENYGIDINSVSAIEREQKVIRIPNAEANIKGIINLRGEVIPVIDLHRKFGTGVTTGYDAAELVIVNLEDHRVALMIDSVSGIIRADEKSVASMPSIAIGKGVTYFKNVIKTSDGSLVIIIDPQRLLSEEETQAVKEISENASEE